MATKNKNLENLSKDDILKISEHFLMGWHDTEKEYGFRVKSLNHLRELYGLEPLDKNLSFEYRIKYIKEHYADTEIEDILKEYLSQGRVSEERWSGIYLFNCRFGRDCTKAFRELLGSAKYRKMSEAARVDKLKETQTVLYGGVGLANQDALSKAQATNIERYGSANVMQSDAVKQKLAEVNTKRYGGVSPFSSDEVRQKAVAAKMQRIYDQMQQFVNDDIIKNLDCFQSEAEKIIFTILVSRFGRKDVMYQYGIHPFDERYPFHCDFYIKSLDLFIEYNGHYSHYNHWFDASNHDDIVRKNNMLTSGSKRNKNALKVWCETDLKKRESAKFSKLNYLVFWDGSEYQLNKKRYPKLKDFYEWFEDYSCDTSLFLQDNPQNTY